jgi:hypothetical protein
MNPEESNNSAGKGAKEFARVRKIRQPTLAATRATEASERPECCYDGTIASPDLAVFRQPVVRPAPGSVAECRAPRNCRPSRR